MDLHDFVLNLISDADARTAFQLDPQASLDAAGLTDVTPANVHDAIPLVADYAPSRVAGLTSGLPDLASAALHRVDASGALQPLTAGLAGTGATNGNLTLAAAGGVAGLTTMTGDTGATGDAPTVVVTDQVHGQVGPVGYSGGMAAGTTDGDVEGSGLFSTAHDPADTLDHGVVDGLDGTAGSLTGTVGGLTQHTLGTVTGTLDSAHGLTGALGHGGVLDPGGLTSAVPGLTSSLPGLDGLHGLGDTSGLLGATDPLHLGGTADASGSAHAHTAADGHLPDVTHLF
jgi:hypothetical protein